MPRLPVLIAILLLALAGLFGFGRMAGPPAPRVAELAEAGPAETGADAPGPVVAPPVPTGSPEALAAEAAAEQAIAAARAGAEPGQPPAPAASGAVPP